jgi:hypothetical protein
MSIFNSYVTLPETKSLHPSCETNFSAKLWNSPGFDRPVRSEFLLPKLKFIHRESRLFPTNTWELKEIECGKPNNKQFHQPFGAMINHPKWMYPPNNKPHWGDGDYGIGFTTLKEHPRLSTLQLGLHTKRLSSVPDFQTLIKPMACGKFWHLPRNRAKASDQMRGCARIGILIFERWLQLQCLLESTYRDIYIHILLYIKNTIYIYIHYI